MVDHHMFLQESIALQLTGEEKWSVRLREVSQRCMRHMFFLSVSSVVYRGNVDQQYDEWLRATI